MHTRRTTGREDARDTRSTILTKSEKTTTAAGRDLRRGQGGQPAGRQVRRQRHGVLRIDRGDVELRLQPARRRRRARRRTSACASRPRSSRRRSARTSSRRSRPSPRRPTSRARKHVLANTTDELINYELRRKMRQVGVQVQDIGTYLCWQTYVDDPGRDARPRQAGPHRQARRARRHSAPGGDPDCCSRSRKSSMVTIPFISIDGTDADNEGEVYVDGVEVDDSEWFGRPREDPGRLPAGVRLPQGRLRADQRRVRPAGQAGQRLAQRRRSTTPATAASFTLHLDRPTSRARTASR